MRMSYSQEDRLCVSDLIWFSVYFCSGIEVSNGLSRFQFQSLPGPYVLLLFFLEGEWMLPKYSKEPSRACWVTLSRRGGLGPLGCYSPATAKEVFSAPGFQPFGCKWIAQGELRNMCLRMNHRRLGLSPQWPAQVVPWMWLSTLTSE